ncbi:hypothetical protein NDU88_004134 [Pleurodeles waltl]|uniref:Uncharacterized protein n=1 Tax=Pleurodeles waltl TaxID=8319 RepID=A0AAV7M5G2_PLEWA|nr:hypothetical protein NDU88_004134 [Pleurodeles waltl]
MTAGLRVAGDGGLVHGQADCVGGGPDISPTTVTARALVCRPQRWREFKPITDHLRVTSTSYTWGHLFRLVFRWGDQLRQVRTLQEVRRMLGMEELEKRDGLPGGGPVGSQPRWRCKEKKRRPSLPSSRERAKERQAF